MHRGYVLVWRKIQDSGLMQMPNTLAVFLHILFSATHQPIKVGTPSGVIELKRGQYISGRQKLAKDLKQSEQQIRTALARLEQLQIISIKSTSKYSIYTIENYDIYQNVNQQLTNKQPTNNQQTTTKQEHNTQKEHNNFDEFWSAYPNKAAKAQAVRAWNKHKPDLQVILDALEWQKETDGWKRGFVPMASTYINNARWEDENPNDKLNDIFAGAI
jgi:hypothetical protein